SALLHAERVSRQGQDPAQIRNILDTSIQRFDAETQQRQLEIDRLEPRSLEEAAARGRAPPDPSKDSGLAKLEALARLEARTHSAKPDPKDVEQWNAERDKFLAAFKEKPLDLAWLVWQAAAGESKPGRNQARVWGGLLTAAWKDLPPSRQPRWVEAAFLRRLAEWADTATDPWPLETVRDALQSVREGERAAAEPEAPSWARAMRNEADARRS